MSDTAPSPAPAADETVAGPALSVSADPALPADVAVEPQARQQPRVQQNDPDVDAKPCEGCGSTGKRNLVVCIDGTSNQFSTKNTNVVELYSRLVKDERQLTFYNSGIGTYAKPSWKSWDYRKQVISNTLDLAFALRFEKIIISAYAWLVDNYRPGDCIFLFGFSRGAYQVRALAAMIDIVGLLHKGNTDQIPFAYELYAASGDNTKNGTADAPPKAWRDIRPLRERISQAWKSRKSKGGEESLPPFPWPAALVETSDPGSSKEDITMQEQFKKTFSREGVRVHFVGAWDTVSSVGFIRDKTLPSTTDGMQCVCFFRHALALHEFRVKFLPEYVNGGAGPYFRSTWGDTPHTKEVWFTGSHSDIGGGSSSNTSLDKFGPALRWMSWEATSAGLRLVATPDNWEPIRVSKSMTNIWRIVECLPIKRQSYPTYRRTFFEDPPTGSSFTWLPHFYACRHIQPHQRIHQSVLEECLKFARPGNVMVEADAYLVLPPKEEVLRRGWIFNEKRMLSLQQLTTSRDGITSLDFFGASKYIYDLARICLDKPDERAKILADLMSLDDASMNGPFQKDRNPQHAINVTHTSSVTFPFRMAGHTRSVSSVACLSDTRVLSGSYDETMRIWDVSTGEMTLGTPLSGHSSDISCVTVHVAKCLVASASDDKTIRLWTSDSNEAVHAEKVLHDRSSDAVLAVAFSPDGSHLVSGSKDGAIRVWNAATGERVGEPVRGHTGWVRSVAFSSDGKRIVSGSDARTVRLWEWSPDEATMQPCGDPLNGHTKFVLSVAFSPNASIIASGSRDETVRIWDVATRTSKFTLKGHTDWVRSVAFAPSGKYVVSGSDDWTARIWDARTGAAVRVLRGHTGSVRSVAFSPDGTRIASGSWDRTVRVWDFVLRPGESHLDEDVQAATHAQIEPA